MHISNFIYKLITKYFLSLLIITFVWVDFNILYSDWSICRYITGNTDRRSTTISPASAMSPLFSVSFLTTALLLGISYSTGARLIPYQMAENDLKTLDSNLFDDLDEIQSRFKKADVTNLPKRFKTAKDMERYMAALNTYYMIFGRPR